MVDPVKLGGRPIQTHNALYRNSAKADVFRGSIRNDSMQNKISLMKYIWARPPRV